MASPNAKKRIMDLLRGTKAINGYYGLLDLALNTDAIISDIYTAPTYSDTDRTNIAATYAKRAIVVMGEYPRQVKDLPAVIVYRVGDGETPKGVAGDEFGYDDDLETHTQDAHLRGTFLDERLKIEIWVDGPSGLRDDIYLAVRELCMRGRGFLHEADMIAPEWTDGRDGQLYDPQATPHIIHKAEAVIHYSVALTWVEKEEKILDVRTNLTGYNNGRIEVEVWSDDM